MCGSKSPKEKARALRKDATWEERHLWYDFLSKHTPRFRRQQPFGAYVVDFYCDKARLAVEVDGSQHFEQAGVEHDKVRTEYLEQVHHLRVLRFSNLEIKQNFEGVCAEIDRVITERFPPSPASRELPPGGA